MLIREVNVVDVVRSCHMKPAVVSHEVNVVTLVSLLYYSKNTPIRVIFESIPEKQSNQTLHTWMLSAIPEMLSHVVNQWHLLSVMGRLLSMLSLLKERKKEKKEKKQKKEKKERKKNILLIISFSANNILQCLNRIYIFLVLIIYLGADNILILQDSCQCNAKKNIFLNMFFLACMCQFLRG